MDLIVFYCDMQWLVKKIELHVMSNHSNCNLNTWLSNKNCPYNTADIQSSPSSTEDDCLHGEIHGKEERVETTYNIWKQLQIAAD